MIIANDGADDSYVCLPFGTSYQFHQSALFNNGIGIQQPKVIKIHDSRRDDSQVAPAGEAQISARADQRQGGGAALWQPTGVFDDPTGDGLGMHPVGDAQYAGMPVPRRLSRRLLAPGNDALDRPVMRIVVDHEYLDVLV
jgi:hypothetical protein